MSDATIPISIEAVPNLAGGLGTATQQLNQFAQSIEQGPLGALGKFSIGLAGVAASFGLFSEALKKGIEASMATESAMVTLRKTVENLGVSYASVGGQIEEAVNHIANFSKFARNDARDAMERLIVITQDFGKSMQALQVVQDLATYKHIKMSEAANMFGLAVEGNTRVLRSIGVVLDAHTQGLFKASSETERFEYLSTLLENRLRGLTEVDAATWSGKWAIAGHQIEEALKGIGDAALAALGNLDSFFRMLRDNIADAMAAASRGVNVPTPIGSIPLFGWAGGGSTSSKAPGWSIGDLGSGPGRKPLPPLSGGPDDFTSQEDKVSGAINEFLRNLKIVTANMGGDWDEAIRKNAAEITRLSEEAARVGVEFTNFTPVLRRLNDIVSRYGVQMDEQVKLYQTMQRPNVFGSIPNASGYGAFGGVIDLATPRSDNMLDLNTRQKLVKDQADRAETERVLDAKALEKSRAEERNKDYQSLLAAGDEFIKKTGDFWGRGIADLLSGKSLAGLFRTNLAGDASSLIQGLLGGAYGVHQDASGGYTFPGSTTSYKDQGAAVGAARLAGAAPGVTIGLNAAQGFASGFTSQQSDLSTIGGGLISGAGIAASLAALYGSLAAIPVYGWIAAAAVAVGTALGKLLQPSPSADYRYGVPSIDQFGNVSVDSAVNLDKNAKAAIVAQYRDTFDTFFNGFNKVLFDLGQTMLKPFAVSPVVGRFEGGADLGLAPSQGYDKELKDYLATGLPQAISKNFYNAISAGFESYGFSGARFQQIWNDAMKLDPKKFLDLMTALGQGAIEMSKTMDYLKTPTGFGGVGITGLDGTMLGGLAQTRRAGGLGPISDAFDAILKQANLVNSTVGAADQANAYKTLADMMASAATQVKAFVQSLADAIASLNKTWSDQINNFKLAGMVDANGKPDYAKQIAFLKQQADVAFSTIGTASSASDVTNISSTLQGLIQRIVGLGLQSGGDPAAWNAWGAQTSQQAQGALIARLQALGAQVDQLNAAFIAKFQPALDQFTTQLTDTGAGVVELGAAAGAASEGLHALAGEAIAAGAAIRQYSEDAGFVSRTGTGRA